MDSAFWSMFGTVVGIAALAFTIYTYRASNHKQDSSLPDAVGYQLTPYSMGGRRSILRVTNNCGHPISSVNVVAVPTTIAQMRSDPNLKGRPSTDDLIRDFKRQMKSAKPLKLKAGELYNPPGSTTYSSNSVPDGGTSYYAIDVGVAYPRVWWRYELRFTDHLGRRWARDTKDRKLRRLPDLH